MQEQTWETDRETAVAVSSPAVSSCQFRLQLYQATQHKWQVYGLFRRREEAQLSLDCLQNRGYRARLVETATAPLHDS